MLTWLSGLPAVGKTVLTHELPRDRIAVRDVRYLCRQEPVHSILDFGDSADALLRYADRKHYLGVELARRYQDDFAYWSEHGTTLIETTPFILAGVATRLQPELVRSMTILTVGVDFATHIDFLRRRFECSTGRARRMAEAYVSVASLVGLDSFDYFLDLGSQRQALIDRLGQMARGDELNQHKGTLILGRANSGKSELAEQRLLASNRQLSYFGTLPPSRCWREKITRHRQRRDRRWYLAEVSGDLDRDLRLLELTLRTRRPLLLDGLAMWIAAALERGPCAVEALYQGLGSALRTQGCEWIVVDPSWHHLCDSNPQFADVVRGFHAMLVDECGATVLQSGAKGSDRDGRPEDLVG